VGNIIHRTQTRNSVVRGAGPFALESYNTVSYLVKRKKVNRKDGGGGRRPNKREKPVFQRCKLRKRSLMGGNTKKNEDKEGSIVGGQNWSGEMWGGK